MSVTKISNLIILVCLLAFQVAASEQSKDAVVQKDRLYRITKRKCRLVDGVYWHSISKLIMKEGSIISISDFFAGRKLVIDVQEFVGSGENTIVQAFSNQFSTRWESKLYTLEGRPRARNGKKGASQTPIIAGWGDDGASGTRGTDGRNGRNSVDLTIQMGIRQIENLRIILVSESGGNGGAGGVGQHGGGARCSYTTGGNGGVGGKGGTGGQPGIVGPVIFKWWELSPIMSADDGFPVNVSVMLIPGASGIPGLGGKGGNGAPDKDSCTFGTWTQPGGRHGAYGPIGDSMDKNRHLYFGKIQVVSAYKLIK